MPSPRMKSPGSPTPSPFGAHLAMLREERGLLQGELASCLDCSRGFVSLLEMGIKHPSQKMVLAIVDALSLDAAETEEFNDLLLVGRGSLEFPRDMPLPVRIALCRYFQGRAVPGLGSWRELAERLAPPPKPARSKPGRK